MAPSRHRRSQVLSPTGPNTLLLSDLDHDFAPKDLDHAFGRGSFECDLVDAREERKLVLLIAAPQDPYDLLARAGTLDLLPVHQIAFNVFKSLGAPRTHKRFGTPALEVSAARLCFARQPIKHQLRIHFVHPGCHTAGFGRHSTS